MQSISLCAHRAIESDRDRLQCNRVDCTVHRAQSQNSQIKYEFNLTCAYFSIESSIYFQIIGKHGAIRMNMLHI